MTAHLYLQRLLCSLYLSDAPSNNRVDALMQSIDLLQSKLVAKGFRVNVAIKQDLVGIACSYVPAPSDAKVILGNEIPPRDCDT